MGSWTPSRIIHMAIYIFLFVCITFDAIKLKKKKEKKEKKNSFEEIYRDSV